MSHRLLTTIYCNPSFPCLMPMLCVGHELVLVLLSYNCFSSWKAEYLLAGAWSALSSLHLKHLFPQ